MTLDTFRDDLQRLANEVYASGDTTLYVEAAQLLDSAARQLWEKAQGEEGGVQPTLASRAG